MFIYLDFYICLLFKDPFLKFAVLGVNRPSSKQLLIKQNFG